MTHAPSGSGYNMNRQLSGLKTKLNPPPLPQKKAKLLKQ